MMYQMCQRDNQSLVFHFFVLLLRSITATKTSIQNQLFWALFVGKFGTTNISSWPEYKYFGNWPFYQMLEM